MLLSLVKKDFILVKKYLLLMVAFVVIAPIFVTSKINLGHGNFVGFLMIALLVEYLLFSTVSTLEDKYKGSALLCATPYTRDRLVKAKYIFILIIFILTYIIYTITAFIAPAPIQKLDIFTLGICFLIMTIFFAVIIPVQYKFGYGKTMYISYGIIFITPFLLPSIVKWLQSKNINFQMAISLPQVIQNLLLYFIALMIGFISMELSIHIYSKKNL